MSGRIHAIRGMHDVLPDSAPAWRWLEERLRALAGAYGYEEIRLPIVERTELFVRSIGEVTDIVEKEMYTFRDLGGDSLTLRPEGTAGCVRACLEHGLIHNQVRRLWYLGPMFRHERPQKGRYRQFHQFGVETYGLEGPDIDAELILMSARLWRMLGLDGLRLEINTLGSPESRAAYRETLVAWLERRRDALDADSLRRLGTNPLRILDSKNPEMQPVLAEAPTLIEHLDDEAARHFEGLRAILDAAGVDYVVNPRLVRGLDYYGRTVFEWQTDRLGAQGTVCAGGRYDRLVEQLGGQAVPAAGFALGIERLLALLEDAGALPGAPGPHVYLIVAGEAAAREAAVIAESLREALPALRLMLHCGGGSFKAQFRKADRSGAAIALVLGDDEIARGEIGVKYLRDDRPQASIARGEAARFLKAELELE